MYGFGGEKEVRLVKFSEMDSLGISPKSTTFVPLGIVK